MKRRPDTRPSVFRTFQFASLDESAAFVSQLAQVGSDHASLIQAHVAGSEVRVRIDPDPAKGKKVAQQLMAQLTDLYQSTF